MRTDYHRPLTLPWGTGQGGVGIEHYHRPLTLPWGTEEGDTLYKKLVEVSYMGIEGASSLVDFKRLRPAGIYALFPLSRPTLKRGCPKKFG